MEWLTLTKNRSFYYIMRHRIIVEKGKEENTLSIKYDVGDYNPFSSIEYNSDRWTQFIVFAESSEEAMQKFTKWFLEDRFEDKEFPLCEELLLALSVDFKSPSKSVIRKKYYASSRINDINIVQVNKYYQSKDGNIIGIVNFDSIVNPMQQEANRRLLDKINKDLNRIMEEQLKRRIP